MEMFRAKWYKRCLKGGFVRYPYIVLLLISLATITTYAQTDDADEGALIIKKNKIDVGTPKQTVKTNQTGKCTQQALIAATEWIKKLLEERVSKGKPLFPPLSFEIGTPYLMDMSKNPPGIMEREWVPIKTKSKDLTQEDHIGLHFDSSCNRNFQSENEAAKKVDEFFKEKTKKNSD